MVSAHSSHQLRRRGEEEATRWEKNRDGHWPLLCTGHCHPSTRIQIATKPILDALRCQVQPPKAPQLLAQLCETHRLLQRSTPLRRRRCSTRRVLANNDGEGRLPGGPGGCL